MTILGASPTDVATRPLAALFEPTSIAVVGASASPGKLGTVMLDAIRNGSSGDVSTFAVNPKNTSDGFHSSLDVATNVHGGPIDLAVLCTPAAATPAAVREAASCGVGSVLICSGGFAETGHDGALLQDELSSIRRETGIRILGPNTSGYFRPGSTTVSFVPTVQSIAPGSVAVVAASGGMNHALSFLLSEGSVGVGFGVGLGNSVDVDNVDVLRHLRDDPAISAIALHVESVDDGPGLLTAVREVSATKPIVAIVVGRSEVSEFAQSHTGALATSWRTTRSLLAQAGAVVVNTELHLVDALTVLSRTRLSASSDPGIGVITAQAGPGLMILDALLDAGVRVPTLSADTQNTLSTLLPPMTFQANPVDTGRPGESFGDVLRATAGDNDVDALAVYALAEPDAIDLVDVVSWTDLGGALPVVLGIGGPAAATGASISEGAAIGVPVLTSPTSLANGIAALIHDAQAQFSLTEDVADALPIGIEIELPADEAASKDLLDALSITTPTRRVCETRDDAHRALSELELPVAVKILDPAVLHKTEIGGVHLGIGTAERLDAALDALDAIGAPRYLLETMAPSGVDLFLGARRDPVFGPIVVAGLGGTAAEAIGDVTIRSGDLTHATAKEMLDDLLSAALLDGWRGGPTLDRVEFARVATSLAAYITAHPDIDDFEINPLRLTAAGLIALDAVVIATPRKDGEPA
ncbi:acetate--CoA ligase family protein [Rhodococcoides fascians A21d2]|uniref:acetate--CoA ligase family protein n=1 Tax=Rhodococcoides fascians TaxID=1828 RepID=UPI00055D016F|nr:acetate--CoA ligase family protein [Rhodococcus fascians]QII00312.1 acetate--CoA ligase family protein [Rhodococcus fascians A21d2]